MTKRDTRAPAKITRRSTLAFTAMAPLVLMPLCGLAQGANQAYPNKLIRVIVPYSPGGSADLIARVISTNLSQALGQPVIVENRPGAGGEIGIAAVASAKPDGYTLLMIPSGSITAGPHFRKTPYDITKDLAPIAMMAVIPTVFAVNASLPVSNLADFIAYARKHPGQINYANPGIGSGNHLAAEMLQRMGNFEMVAVPYQGASASATALASGEVQAGSGDLTSLLPFESSGKIRILAAYGPTRTLTAPNIPTVAEAGVSNYRAQSWAGAFAPSKTPPQIVARINGEIMRILPRPDVREALLKAGLEPAQPMSADDFRQTVLDEYYKTGKLIKEANINPNQ